MLISSPPATGEFRGSSASSGTVTPSFGFWSKLLPTNALCGSSRVAHPEHRNFKRAFGLMRIWLETKGLQGPSVETIKDAVGTLEANAYDKGLYSTLRRRKLWVPYPVVRNCLSAVFTVPAAGVSPMTAAVLGRYIVIQILKWSHIRRTSWLDTFYRQAGHVGAYEKWGMIAFRFPGHDEEAQPLLNVAGRPQDPEPRPQVRLDRAHGRVRGLREDRRGA